MIYFVIRLQHKLIKRKLREGKSHTTGCKQFPIRDILYAENARTTRVGRRATRIGRDESLAVLWRNNYIFS